MSNKIAGYVTRARQLLCLEEAARCGSISGASEYNNIKQPNLSAQITALEKSVQQPLLKRHSKGVSLTESGYIYYAKACELKNILNELDNIDPANNKISGTLRVWTTDGLASLYLAKCFERFYEQYPKITLEIKCSMQQPQLQEFDIALLFEKPNIKSLNIVQKHTLSFGLYTSKTYLNHKDIPENIADLCAHHRVCSNLTFISRWPLWKNICNKASRKTFIDNSSNMLLTLLEKGVGIGLVPDIVASQNTNLVRLEGILPNLTSDFYIIVPKNALQNQKVTALTEIINLETSR